MSAATVTRRGTTNGNARGSAADRLRRLVRSSKEYGSWAMRTECGYPPDCHPEGTDHRSPHLGKEGVQ